VSVARDPASMLLHVLVMFCIFFVLIMY
jgi:hypothetical protein